MKKPIIQTYIINATCDKVWDGLTNPKTIEKWSGAKAVMNDAKDTNFKLWDGEVFGKNLEVIKNKKLVQEWTSGNWEKPSTVIFNLRYLNGRTEVELIQTDVPDEEVKDIENGWKDYYMNPLKELVEKD